MNDNELMAELYFRHNVPPCDIAAKFEMALEEVVIILCAPSKMLVRAKDPRVRLEIIQAIGDKAMSVYEISKATDIMRGSVHRYLARFVEEGLLIEARCEPKRWMVRTSKEATL